MSHSPTLEPPRKSIELEDPGAHDLDSSEAENEDHFSDAQEDRASHSGPSSPIPSTRVEKVDDRESYGEVPGTAAYKLREQDAVPDTVEVLPESSIQSTTSSHESQPGSPAPSSIPKTVVEKVDPLSPSHGDVPGTAAHSKRMADAVPDIIRPASRSGNDGPQEDLPGASTSEVPIPTTIVTRVDSKPAHGEVPGTEAHAIRQGDAEPDIVEKRDDVQSEYQLADFGKGQRDMPDASPIAADGGFGPMGSDSEMESTDGEGLQTKESEVGEESLEDKEVNEGFGDDFDDFEAGNEEEDFGDFDEGTQQPSISSSSPPKQDSQSQQAQPQPIPDIPFPLLDFSDLDTLDDIIEASQPYLDEIFPTTKAPYTDLPPPLPSTNSIFLTERSHSLWSQLVAPPPLQPPNWVRSRIRRLFLVSLGVPVDLDEILPASKQKKLILPSTHPRRSSSSPARGKRAASRARLKQDNASSTSIDKSGTSAKPKKRKGPIPPPDLDLQTAKMVCTTTEAALSNMTDEELLAHSKKLQELTSKASEVLEYWLKHKDSALGDKEAFEGVIENLVKHARRVRK